MSELVFYPLAPDDLFEIERQESQVLWLGAPGEVDAEAAQLISEQDCSWTAWADGRILACFGISETFPGSNGVAWSLLSRSIGKYHLPLTRFMRGELERSGLPRIELLAKALEVEPIIEKNPHVTDPATWRLAAMADPTPECRWAVLLGFTPAHLLRRFGAACESYMLFERFGETD